MTKPLAFRGKGQGKHKKKEGAAMRSPSFFTWRGRPPWRMFFRGKIRGRRLFRRRPPEEISSCGGKSAFCVIGRFSLEKCSIMQLRGKKEKRSRKIFGAAPFAFRRDLFCFVKKITHPQTRRARRETCGLSFLRLRRSERWRQRPFASRRRAAGSEGEKCGKSAAKGVRL